MNINAFTIYLWQLADKLGSSLFLASMFCGGVAVFTWIYALSEDDSFIPITKRLTVLSIVGFFLFAFLPTSKTIAMMVVVPSIANSKAIQRDVPELYDMAIKSLKEKISPVKEETK